MKLRYIWSVIGLFVFGYMGYYYGDQGILSEIPRVLTTIISALMGGLIGLVFGDGD